MQAQFLDTGPQYSDFPIITLLLEPEQSAVSRSHKKSRLHVAEAFQNFTFNHNMIGKRVFLSLGTKSNSWLRHVWSS